MKFSLRQILRLRRRRGHRRAVDRVDVFGVKGTIVGVAIGSAAATIATALVAQSIERGQRSGQAGRGAGARAVDPAAQAGWRRLRAATRRRRRRSRRRRHRGGRRGRRPRRPDGRRRRRLASRPERLEISAAADAPATERIEPPPCRCSLRPDRPAAGGPVCCLRSAGRPSPARPAIVFVLALLFVTAIELISGQPLSAIFGNAAPGPACTTSSRRRLAVAAAPTSTTTSPRPRRRPPRRSTSTTTSTTTTTTTTTAHADRELDDHVDDRRRLLEHDHHPGSGCDDDDVSDGSTAAVVDAAAGYQPLNSAGPPLHEAGDALLGVERVGEELLSHRLVVQRGGTVDIEGAVGQPLGDPDRLGGALGQPAGQLLERRLELGRGAPGG